MIPPRYVKPYVKRGKNDALDAEAICEAVQRPSMRFVPLKTAEQQGALVIHKTRDLLVRQRAILVNALRSHLAEFGIIVAKDIGNTPQLAAVVRDKTDRRVPATARSALVTVVDSIDALSRRIRSSKPGSGIGIERTSRASIWPPSPGLDRSPPPPLPRRYQIRRLSAPAATSPLGLV